MSIVSMNATKKKIAIGALSLVTVASLGMGVAAHAASSSTDPMSGLVDKIATRFNLNKADVQKVFDDNRTEHDAQRTAEQKTRLDAAVTAGTITADQEKLITAKLAELKTARDNAKNMTDDQRKAAMKSERDSLKAWATDNKIPMNLLRPMGGPHHGGHGPMNGGAPNSNSTN